MPGHAGSLLVADPALVDPNFRRSVVLLLDHDEDGALGVIVNRPSELGVARVLPVWGDHASDPGVVFEGGPVTPDGAIGVVVPAAETTLGAIRMLTDRFGILDLDADPDDVVPLMGGLRIFAGYAGWSPGQLEAEIAEGSWHLAPALTADVLSTTPTALWREVLRRQPGETAFLATYPDDPTWN